MDQHFLESSQFSVEDILKLLKRAAFFKQSSRESYPHYPESCLANLFYEPSTRTRVSFEMAAKNLGIRVVNLDCQFSSEMKGEAIEDSLRNLAAMGINLFAIRHPQNGLPKALAAACPIGAHIINAGDGSNEHPSQGLLDLLTIQLHKPNLNELKIVIVGDLYHSRVANTFQTLAALMGVGELVLVAPEIWHPRALVYGRLSHSLTEAVTDADVIICLRVQKERLAGHEYFDLTQYHQLFGIKPQALTLAKPGVMVMHPGPINRGVEIDSAIADGPHSFILEQVNNGVFMRMAILESLIFNE